MHYINKNFEIPHSLKYLQREQENGDILFIARGNALSASYGSTEWDIKKLKQDIIAILYSENGLLCLNNCGCKERNGFTEEQKSVVAQIESDYKNKIHYVEGGNTTFVDDYFAS